MKPKILLPLLVVLFSCEKDNTVLRRRIMKEDSYILYKIPEGHHYCQNNTYQNVETSEMKFSVIFDSTAIYRTIDQENQYDVNKLYGFSDNRSTHHEYSARIGWRWSDDSLRLFGYVYNGGYMEFQEITAVNIMEEINCSIQIKGGVYVFQVNESELLLPRLSTTPDAQGYQLYPYFGGDEPAPHQVNIWIKEK